MSSAPESDDQSNLIVLDLRASQEAGELARLARRAGADPKVVEKILYLMIHGPVADREFFVGWVNRQHQEAMRREQQRSDAKTRAIEAAGRRAERDELKV